MVAVYEAYAPLWAALTPEAKHKVTKGNYEFLFDRARRQVRAWEQADMPAPSFEIREQRRFPADALPADATGAVVRRIAEVLNAGAREPVW